MDGDRMLVGLTGLASAVSTYLMFTMQLGGLVAIFQSLAKQIFLLGIWVGVLFIVSGLVVKYIPDLSAASPRLIRGGAYLLVGLAVLNLLFSAFGYPLMSTQPYSGTLMQYLASTTLGSYSMQLLEILILLALFLGVFTLSFGPGFIVGYFGNVPLFHKYHLIVIGVGLLLSMAMLGIVFGFLVWVFLLPYYFLGVSIAYMARQEIEFF
jgi:hypothetical protein